MSLSKARKGENEMRHLFNTVPYGPYNGKRDGISPFRSGDFLARLPELPEELRDYYPAVDPGRRVLLDKILIQHPRPKAQTKSGIFLTATVQESDINNSVIGRVVDIGEGCYTNWENKTKWPVAPVQLGDFVCLPIIANQEFRLRVASDGNELDYIKFTLCSERDIAAIVLDPSPK